MRHPFAHRLFFLMILITILVLGRCGIRGSVKLDPDSEYFYDHARLIMSKHEKDLFHLLPDKESRDEFIEEFWAKRDPDPFTEENEFKDEFYQRIEYANKRFHEGVPGWKTDRGRIYIYLGPPDKIEQRPFINDPNIKGLIWWGYYKYRLGVEFVDTTGEGRYSLSRTAGSSGNLLDVIEKAKFGRIYDDKGDLGTIFSQFDLDYDQNSKEIYISIPVESLSFEAVEDKLKVEFKFEFFIYQKNSPEKLRFQRQNTFETTEAELVELEEIVLTFPYDLDPGEYIVDVIAVVEPKIGKIRKIFRIKV